MPTSASARLCAATPAVVTGAIAPARMNGVKMQAWLLRGVDLGGAEHGFIPHQRRRSVDQAGHHRAVVQVATESDASQIYAVLALLAAVTDPMKGLSLYFRCE